MSVGARWLNADGELAGGGHGVVRKLLIIRWGLSMSVETWTFFGCVSTVRFITD